MVDAQPARERDDQNNSMQCVDVDATPRKTPPLGAKYANPKVAAHRTSPCLARGFWNTLAWPIGWTRPRHGRTGKICFLAAGEITPTSVWKPMTLQKLQHEDVWNTKGPTQYLCCISSIRREILCCLCAIQKKVWWHRVT